jgi:hypothetical protein
MAEMLELTPRDANRLLLAAGYAPLPNPEEQGADPSLSLIDELFHDPRVLDSELNLLREYVTLLDRLRQQR